MTTLSATQIAILTAASQRQDRIALPLPANLRGGAAAKVIAAMLAKGLLEEGEANLRRGEPLWRETGDGHGTTLVATDAGLAAIGAPTTPEATEAPTPRPQRALRADTKQAALIAMLRAPEGATLDEIVAATGWLKHTARGAMAGAIKKRLGLTLLSEVEEGRGRVYRIPS
jgi:hypothetical protein